MNRKIKDVRAMEILDSRGNPTIKVIITLDNGITASASYPSGRPNHPYADDEYPQRG